jgi:ribonuclease HI
MEMQNWKIISTCNAYKNTNHDYFSWIKAHAGHHRKDLADQLAKEAATSRKINECYKLIPKSTVFSELSEQCNKVAR